MPNERNNSSLWKNAAAGLGVAGAAFALVYLIKNVLDSGEEETAETNRNALPERPHRRRKSFSQQRSIIIDQINNGTLECPICLDKVERKSKIISCKTCYNIFHLKCYKEYVNHKENNYSETTCPLCRENMPDFVEYYCFCGKTLHPNSVAGRTPHTCALKCNCGLSCHPGPCDL